MDNLLGMTASVWWKLLKENRFAISPRYSGRALVMTLASLSASANRKFDEELYLAEIASKIEIRQPVFILGHWRSGTTFLHSILSVDPQFTSPSIFEVMNPWTFLKNEEIAYKRWADVSLKRRMDNVLIEPMSPGEDEFAVSSMCLRSPLIGWSFTRRADFYDRYLSFNQASTREVQEWKDALLVFLKKVAYKHPGRLLLKSPPHTARIRLLLEMFPEASFIAIHRDPFAVYRSTMNMVKGSLVHGYLQGPPDEEELSETTFRRYNLMYDAFFEDLQLIPAGRYCEVGFEDLEKDPLRVVHEIYEKLGLPGNGEVETSLRHYIESLAGYQKNPPTQMPNDLKQKIAKRWQRTFDQWGYSTNGYG